MRGFILATILFLGGLAGAIALIGAIGGDEIALATREFSAVFLAPIVLLLVIEALLSTWRWHIILRAQGDAISFKALIPVWMAGNAFNYISPIVFMGGEGVRIFMLKNRFNIAYHRGASSVVVDQLFNGLSVVAVVVAGAGVLAWYVSSPGTTTALIVVSAIFGPALAAIGLLFAQAFRNKPTFTPILKLFSLHRTRFGTFTARTEKEMSSFLSLSSRAFWLVLGVTVARQITIIARAMFVLAALGVSVAWADGLLALSGVFVAYALPIPLAIGTQEAAQTALFGLLGWGVGTGILFSALYRATELALVFGGAVVLARSFTEFAANNIFKAIGLNGEEEE